MREAVAWVLVAVLLAWNLWPRPEPGLVQNVALRAQNDSLRSTIEARDYREAMLSEAADSLRMRLDSMVNNAPAPEVRYLAWHAALRGWSNDSLWRFMGAWPADTGAARYFAPLGSDQRHD